MPNYPDSRARNRFVAFLLKSVENSQAVFLYQGMIWPEELQGIATLIAIRLCASKLRPWGYISFLAALQLWMYTEIKNPHKYNTAWCYLWLS